MAINSTPINGTPGNDNGIDFPALIGTPEDDFISGLGGNDLLDGAAGKDELIGGIGDDTLKGGKGDDTLDGQAGVNLLDGGDGNDLLFGSFDGETQIGGKGNDELNGEDGADSQLGGSGNDTLAGGDGNDTLTGGKGADQFKFFDPKSGGNDLIKDFSVRDDTILVMANESGFGPLPLGAITADQFNIGASSLDANTRFIYDNTTGALSFDADGINPITPQIQIATLSPGLKLTNADIVAFM